jgi:Ca2+-binding RTX toxin-like protein
LSYLATTGGTYKIQVFAEGTGKGEYTLFSAITTNSAPAASINGPSTGVRGQPRTYTLSAADDSSTIFTFQLDWNGDDIIDETVIGASGTQVSHVFVSSGSYTVKVTATDGEGATSTTSSLPVTISDWALQVDDTDPLKTNLVVGGTNGVDAFGFVPGIILVQVLNNQFYSQPLVIFTGGFNGKLIVYGQGSGDLLFADVMTASVEFHGGEGDDVLVGGRGSDWIDGGNGNDIILGGSLDTDGDDLLSGGAGDDLIIGHLGADSLYGGSGQDLLVAGQLYYGNLPNAVYSIQAEWTSGRPYADRVANLQGSGVGPRFNGETFLTPGITVLDDGAVDSVLGDSEEDWLLYDFSEDLATDVEIFEIATDIG